MSRSRSSFDLAGAIATATSLGPDARPHGGVQARYAGLTLVSFGPAPSEASAEVPPASDASDDVGEDTTGRPAPPKLPDLTGIVSPAVRCERIVGWIIEATGAEDVFIADSSGLPIAGAIANAEAQLAGAGVVAQSVAALSAATPGLASPMFELHVGEGPFFQLIGFRVGALSYVVGLTRSTPLSPRQAHAIRLACRHALADSFGGVGRAEPTEAPRAAQDMPPRTLAFPPLSPPAQARSADAERVERLLAYVDEHAAEPHVARLRVALKAGLTPLALEHPEALRPEAMVLIETAVEEILGVSLAVIRRLE